jgi:hypothetical protein
MDFNFVTNIFSVLANTATLTLIIFALLQLRIMNKDREASLTIRVFDRFSDANFVLSYDWVSKNISRESSGTIDFFSEEGRKIRKVAIIFEEVGILLKTKSIRKDLILSLVSNLTIDTGNLLEEFIKKERGQQNNNALWDNFENLKDESIIFVKKRGGNYDK